MPAIYPTLVGLTYSVIKRPKWSTGRAVAASGRDVRIAYWVYPLWEWELTYDYLPDRTSPSDLKTIIGFFLSVSGGLVGFLFQDPDDNTVINQTIGTGDGCTFTYLLVRTYGGVDGTGTEPIGYLDSGTVFNVYLNGTLQAPSAYSVDTSRPVYQLITFTAAPAAGDLITVDMSYFYYVHFKDDTQDFEKFMNQLWLNKKVTLESLRR